MRGREGQINFGDRKGYTGEHKDSLRDNKGTHSFNRKVMPNKMVYHKDNSGSHSQVIENKAINLNDLDRTGIVVKDSRGNIVNYL